MQHRPWDDWVERVVLHTPFQLTYDGRPSLGGRERYVRDVATLVRDEWRRPVVIAQMGNRDFEAETPEGFPVVAKRAYTRNAAGEPMFSWWLHRSFARRTDAIVYASGECAWPFFRQGSKGFQHGIWWDGPLSLTKRTIQQRRVMRYVDRMRSVLCVDTNLINYLRQQGPRGMHLAARCRYLPNYADASRIDSGAPDRAPGRPLRLLFARRFEACRGPLLFLDTLAELERRRFPFEARMFAIGGGQTLRDAVRARGLERRVILGEAGLDDILGAYRDADVSVIPTVWSEGTSFAAVESIVAGVPVVTTPVGGLANLVIPGVNGEIAAPDPKALADAIETLGDEQVWRGMRRRCLEMRPALGMERWRREVLAWLKD